MSNRLRFVVLPNEAFRTNDCLSVMELFSEGKDDLFGRNADGDHDFVESKDLLSSCEECSTDSGRCGLGQFDLNDLIEDEKTVSESLSSDASELYSG